MIKFRKLVKGVTGHGFDMQRYEKVISGGNKLKVMLYVANGGHGWLKRRLGLVVREEEGEGRNGFVILVMKFLNGKQRKIFLWIFVENTR